MACARAGVPLAQRLGAYLTQIEHHPVPVGAVDITLYRDDLRQHKSRPVHSTDIPCLLDAKHVVLVDDVLYTGRSIRAAMDALTDFGRPQTMQLAVLIDRGHRELPIRADYIGKSLPTARSEQVSVRLQEVDGDDAVAILEEPGTMSESQGMLRHEEGVSRQSACYGSRQGEGVTSLDRGHRAS